MRSKRIFAGSVVGATIVFAAIVLFPSMEGDRLKIAPQEAQRQTPRGTAVSTTLGRPTIAAENSAGESLPAAFSHQFRTTLSLIEKVDDPDKREQLLVGMVAGFDTVQLQRAITHLKSEEPSAFTSDVQGRLLRQWAETEPSPAAFAALETGTENRQNAVSGVIGAWAERDLAGVIEWAGKLPDGESKDVVLVCVAYEAARLRPEDALRLAGSLSPAEARDEVLVHAAAQWASIAPEIAARWADEVADDGLRRRLQAAVAVAWSEADPLEAASFALRSISVGTLQDDALVGIVQRWVQSDPQGVANLVEMFPESAMRDVAMENLIKLWAGQNPEAAGNWLNSLAVGPVRDSGVSPFAETIAISSPAAAIAWAGSISNPILREQKLEDVGEIWMRKDPANASAWIIHASLSSATRKRLLTIEPDGT